ncbi:glycosyltransferase [Fibrisoma montanum]|uniref:Glycosyltransferase n=1 Tax=Fibrisoma montanum TaxID=2305895 RepID=A0A418MAM3_9BACT|nr:glycosyltransferase [Fibrisoma montanum]RIV23425.1 glycosyltransferase [Fibrisoma montanum]
MQSLAPASDKLAPIVLFAYKRPAELEQTIAALKDNHLAKESELYVFVDGPKRPEDLPKVTAVRQLVSNLSGFKAVNVTISDKNRGLARSVIEGVTHVLNKHRQVIVLEDDLITSPNFLNYMNQCLQHYIHNKTIFSITGYSFPFRKPVDYTYDAYFFPRTGSWGWATWADRWQLVDWNVSDFDQFMRDPVQRRAFNQGGDDRVRMLQRQQNGEMDSWAIRFCYSQFKNKALTVYPTISKVNNIGFYTNDATNTNVFNRYTTVVDKGEQHMFALPDAISLHPQLVAQFRNRFSLSVRIWNRLKTYAGMR